MQAICAADRLERFAVELNEPHGFERSFKLCAGDLLEQRFLMSWHRSSFGKKPWEPIEQLGRDLNIPATFVDALSGPLTSERRADIIHLGVESGSGGDVCKVYFEFADEVRAAMADARADQQPILVHEAFKWLSTDSSKRAITRYYYRPGISWRAISNIVETCYSTDQTSALNEVRSSAASFIQFLSERACADDIFFLEVCEEGNARASFDIKLYDLDMTLAHVEPFLQAIVRSLKVPEARWVSVIDSARDKALGHVSGGVDRHGKPFFSVYFDVESR